MASRSLGFLHNCVQEISILELAHPPGSIACWTFLSCLEILLTCERCSDQDNRIQLYCLYTAALRSYAREKLEELGIRKIHSSSKRRKKCFIAPLHL